MAHPDFHKRLSAAGIANRLGSRRKGQNAVLRSARQRRKAFGLEKKATFSPFDERQRMDGFEKESAALIRAFQMANPLFVRPETPGAYYAARAASPAFDALCEKLDALAMKWGV